MTQVIQWCSENWQGVLAVLGGVVTAATAVVKLTPTPKDDAILAKIISVLATLSLVNPDGSFVGKAK